MEKLHQKGPATQWCHDEGIIPPDLNIKYPIPTKYAKKKIIKRAHNDLVKEQIRHITYNINNINKEIEREAEQFQLTFPMDSTSNKEIQQQLDENTKAIASKTTYLAAVSFPSK